MVALYMYVNQQGHSFMLAVGLCIQNNVLIDVCVALICLAQCLLGLIRIEFVDS